MENKIKYLNAHDLGVGENPDFTITIVVVGDNHASLLTVSPDRALQLAELITERAQILIEKKKADWNEYQKKQKRKSARRLISEYVEGHPIGYKFTATEVAHALGLNPGATSNILLTGCRGVKVERVGDVPRGRRFVNLFERVA